MARAVGKASAARPAARPPPAPAALAAHLCFRQRHLPAGPPRAHIQQPVDDIIQQRVVLGQWVQGGSSVGRRRAAGDGRAARGWGGLAARAPAVLPHDAWHVRQVQGTWGRPGGGAAYDAGAPLLQTVCHSPLLPRRRPARQWGAAVPAWCRLNEARSSQAGEEGRGGAWRYWGFG